MLSPSAGTESRYLWRFAPPGKGRAGRLACKMRGHAGSTRRDADRLGHRARRGGVSLPGLPRARPLRRRGLLLDVVAPPGHRLLRSPAHGGLARPGRERAPPRRAGRAPPLPPLRRAGGGLRRPHRPRDERRPAGPRGGRHPRRHLPHPHAHRRPGPARRAGGGGLRRGHLARGPRAGKGLDRGRRRGRDRAPLQVHRRAPRAGAHRPRAPRRRPAPRAPHPLALAGRGGGDPGLPPQPALERLARLGGDPLPGAARPGEPGDRAPVPRVRGRAAGRGRRRGAAARPPAARPGARLLHAACGGGHDRADRGHRAVGAAGAGRGQLGRARLPGALRRGGGGARPAAPGLVARAARLHRGAGHDRGGGLRPRGAEPQRSSRPTAR